MTPVVDQDDAETRLGALNVGWGLISGTELERVFEFKDFASGLDFVNKVANVAERLNHHPDIQLSWGKVVIRLSTHSEGGLTTKDFELAKQIDELAL